MPRPGTSLRSIFFTEVSVENNTNTAFQWRLSLMDARHRIHALEVEKATIARAMETLIQRFTTTFSVPCLVRLTLQRVAQGNVYVRWRLPGRNGDQPYVDMAGETGRALLQSFSVDMQRLLMQYAYEAMCLNLAHSVRQSEWLRLRQFVADYESLTTFRRW